MGSRAREAALLRHTMLIACAAGWLLLAWSSGDASTPAALHLHGPTHGPATTASLITSLGGHAREWVVMLVAMMSPILIEPLVYLHRRSLTARRLRVILAFLAGYAAIWMLVGGGMLALLLAIERGTQGSSWIAIALGTATIIWQCSPLKQHCLNRCHAREPLPVFGIAADIGASRFGIAHGLWCVGSCWAVMLLPMVLPSGRVVAMAAGALLVFSERLEPAARPAWRVRGFGRLWRIAIARARMTLESAFARRPATEAA